MLALGELVRCTNGGVGGPAAWPLHSHCREIRARGSRRIRPLACRSLWPVFGTAFAECLENPRDVRLWVVVSTGIRPVIPLHSWRCLRMDVVALVTLGRAPGIQTCWIGRSRSLAPSWPH